MSVKAIGKTIKGPLFKQISSTIKNSINMFRRNKNTIKRFSYGLEEKYYRTRHAFKNKSVKHLGGEWIKKFKYTVPYKVGGGKQLARTKNTWMKLTAYMNKKELRSAINMVPKIEP